MSGERLSVLVVEDDPADALIVRQILRRYSGHALDVREAASLADAIAALERAPADIVLLDLSLPDGDGAETVLAICAAAPRAAVVVLSGREDEAIVLEALRHGVQDYLVKWESASTVLRALRYAALRKQAELALAQNEEELRRLTDAVPALIAYVDHERRYRLANHGYEEWFGVDRKDIVGLTVDELFGDEAFRAIEPHVERALAGEVTSFDALVRYRSVGARHVRSHYVPHVDASGRVLGFYAMTIDVSDTRRLQEERERLLQSERAARGDAERASRLKDEFLATLSHELRTPLHAILGWAQLLRRTGADVSRGLEIIERNARSQAQLIDDLLDMSRIMSGRMRLDARRMYPVAPVEAALESVRPSLDAKNIALELSLDPRAGPVLGDPARIQQIVWNLLSNAIKFTALGGRVAVAVELVGAVTRIRVSDSGQGIEPEFLPHVFDRFRQADSSTTRRFGGLGLGLAIVKQLVELHGGTARAASEGVGLGATFSIDLPLVGEAGEDTSPERASGTRSARWAGRATETGAAPRLERVDVIVVDDDPDARELSRRMLENGGATVRVASCADEALAEIEARPPDVLVSDIGMPGVDGYELVRRLRALPMSRGGATPAVALTAFARAEDKAWALGAGYQRHVPKPVRAAELVSVVAALAGQARPKLAPS